jgi:ABC-type uncharacterized transport system permease subunit
MLFTLIHKSMAEYYDFVLALIPVVFGGLAGSLSMLGAKLPVAVVAASFAAVLIMGHAMFVRAPVGDTVARGTAPAVDSSAN